MDGHISEKDMEERSPVPPHAIRHPPGLGRRQLPWFSGRLLDGPAKETKARAGDELQARDRPVAQPFLRQNDRRKSFQPANLPVNVQHFRGQESRTEKRNSRTLTTQRQ
jgi:hypothetical protein